MDEPHGCPSVYTVRVVDKLKHLQETDNRDGPDRVERMRSHLSDHAPRHFGNVFENHSVVLCGTVHYAMRAIVNCFLEVVIY